MSWFSDERGNISPFKVAVAIAIFGGIVLIGGYIIFDLELRNARQPLNIDIPSSTELLAVDDSGFATGRRLVFYTTPLPAEEVAAFYDQKLADFQNLPVGNPMRERCRRQPREGNFREYTPGNGSLPYYWDCLFDNTRTYDQFTSIRIYPGQNNSANGENFDGLTRIDYEQAWQP
jgi:hypothetical protein